MTKPRFKLDECVDVRAAQILREAGYEAVTVGDQAMGGRPDQHIADVCAREGRCLLTADLHFSNILDLPPEKYHGIIVLRHPRLRLAAMLNLVRQLVLELRTRCPSGELWIVEPGRVRIHTGQRS